MITLIFLFMAMAAFYVAFAAFYARLPIVSPLILLSVPVCMQSLASIVHPLAITHELKLGNALLYFGFFICTWLGCGLAMTRRRIPKTKAIRAHIESFAAANQRRLLPISIAMTIVQAGCFAALIVNSGGIPMFKMIDANATGVAVSYDEFNLPFYTQFQMAMIPVVAFCFGLNVCLHPDWSLLKCMVRSPVLLVCLGASILMGLGIGSRMTLVSPLLTVSVFVLLGRRVKKQTIFGAVAAFFVLLLVWVVIGKRRSQGIENYAVSDQRMLDSIPGQVYAWSTMYLVPNIWNFQNFVDAQADLSYGAYAFDKLSPGDPMLDAGLRKLDATDDASNKGLYEISTLTFIPAPYDLHKDFGAPGVLVGGVLLGFALTYTFSLCCKRRLCLVVSIVTIAPTLALIAINWFYGMSFVLAVIVLYASLVDAPAPIKNVVDRKFSRFGRFSTRRAMGQLPTSA